MRKNMNKINKKLYPIFALGLSAALITSCASNEEVNAAPQTPDASKSETEKPDKPSKIESAELDKTNSNLPSPEESSIPLEIIEPLPEVYFEPPATEEEIQEAPPLYPENPEDQPIEILEPMEPREATAEEIAEYKEPILTPEGVVAPEPGEIVEEPKTPDTSPTAPPESEPEVVLPDYPALIQENNLRLVDACLGVDVKLVQSLTKDSTIEAVSHNNGQCSYASKNIKDAVGNTSNSVTINYLPAKSEFLKNEIEIKKYKTYQLGDKAYSITTEGNPSLIVYKNDYAVMLTATMSDKLTAKEKATAAEKISLEALKWLNETKPEPVSFFESTGLIPDLEIKEPIEEGVQVGPDNGIVIPEDKTEIDESIKNQKFYSETTNIVKNFFSNIFK